MRILLFLLSLFLIIACSKSTQPKTIPSVEYVSDRATVSILHNEQSICGGVAISPYHIVTALHCVRDNDRVQYFDLSETKNATVIAENRMNDLAILKMDEMRQVWAPLQINYEIQPGDRVNVGGIWVDVKRTNVLLRSTSSGMIKSVIVLDLPAVSGRSGSGMWDEYGYLAGIHTGFELSTNDATYAPVSGILFTMCYATPKCPLGTN